MMLLTKLALPQVPQKVKNNTREKWAHDSIVLRHCTISCVTVQNYTVCIYLVYCIITWHHNVPLACFHITLPVGNRCIWCIHDTELMTLRKQFHRLFVGVLWPVNNLVHVEPNSETGKTVVRQGRHDKAHRNEQERTEYKGINQIVSSICDFKSARN